MIKSKTKIENQLKNKTSSLIVETVVLAKKNPAWIEVAAVLTTPGRKRKPFNLSEIQSAESETVVIPGKVLGEGLITKKKKVIALNFSQTAKDKLKAAGCEVLTIIEAIKKDKDAKGVVILRK